MGQEAADGADDGELLLHRHKTERMSTVFFPGAVTLFLQSVCQTETDLSSQIKTDHLSAAAPGFKIGLSWREKGAQPIAHVRLHT